MTATASNLPNGRKTYLDANGKPLAGGSVGFYIPSTMTLAPIWQDYLETTPQQNPVTLLSDGTTAVFGDRLYREIVSDSLGNEISDTITGGLSINTVMQPVLAATTTGNALTALGINPVIQPALSQTSLPLVLQALGIGALSLLNFGGKNDGSGDNLSAWNAAIAASSQAHCVIYAPAGTYNFSAAPSYSAPTPTSAIFLYGDGAENTKFVFPNGNGVSITMISPNNSFHVRDLSILSGTAGGGTGLAIGLIGINEDPALTQASDVTNVTIRGSDGLGQTNYFGTGISINGASQINFTNLLIAGSSANLGTGTDLFGSASIIPVVFNFVNCIYLNSAVGINYGAYVQGVTINQCNFTFVNTGISTAASLLDLAQLTIANSQFNCATRAISLLTNPAGTVIIGNFIIDVSGSTAIYLQDAGLYSIIGNQFFGIDTTNTTGIHIAGSSASGIITGNAFVNISGNAIQLDAASSNVNVQSNSYQGCGANVANAGTANIIGGGSQ